MTNNYTEEIRVRVSPAIRELIEAMAKAEGCKLSGMVRTLVIEGGRRRGLIQPLPPVVVEPVTRPVFEQPLEKYDGPVPERPGR